MYVLLKYYNSYSTGNDDDDIEETQTAQNKTKTINSYIYNYCIFTVHSLTS